ncbi:MAG: hypothetical protein AAGK00_10325 [Pseudomonadota bacterium]
MYLKVLMCAVTALSLQACSAYMAASGEDKRDISILTVGTHRDIVVSEFGLPVTSVNEMVTVEGSEPTLNRYDVFKFTQGRSDASNAGRAVFYGAAAVLTLGLSEVIATPLEMAVGDQGELRLRTTYGADWLLTKAELQDGGQWVSIPEFEARAAARQKALENDVSPTN